MLMLENCKFGERYLTENGQEIICTGKFHDHFIFMFDGHIEISLYDIDGMGPYGLMLGAGCLFKQRPFPNVIIKQIDSK